VRDHCARGVVDDGRESDARTIHDLILAINDRPVEALAEIMREIRDGVLFAGRGGILDVTDFETVFAQHRFHDQAGTWALAQQLELMRKANQVHIRELHVSA
jgi:hypothetical protein